MPFANGIRLVAGQQYYIEAVAREGSGGDDLGATFRLIEEFDPADGEATRLTGNVIAADGGEGLTT